MAIRSVATTDTLDTFRTTFNSLASTDIGDVATLTTSASTVVGAVNEVNSSVAGDLVIQTFGHRYNADGSNTYTQFTVTVAAKTSTHIYNGTGSSNGYLLNDSVSPFISFKVGNTYRFDQADATNSGHPLRFYSSWDKAREITTGVTTSGTPGSSGAYTQIEIDGDTPTPLYYQCSSHAYMGHIVEAIGGKRRRINNVTDKTYTGDGSTTAFTCLNGVTVDDVLVVVNGIVLTPTDDYTISGTTLTFVAAPAASAEIVFRYLG